MSTVATKPMLEAALDYATDGIDGAAIPIFPAFFDTRNGGRKQPLTKWRDGVDSTVAPINQRLPTSNRNTIRNWWAKSPHAAICMPTGKTSGYFVIEADVKIVNEDGRTTGIDMLEELQAEHGQLTPTRMHRSATGGPHYLYRMPADGRNVTNSAIMLPKGVDVRGTGGMVVLPPSVRPGVGEYAVVDDRPPVQAPEWLLGLLALRQRGRRAQGGVRGRPVGEWARMLDQTWLDGSGRYNDLLVPYAGRLVALANGRGRLGNEEAQLLLRCVVKALFTDGDYQEVADTVFNDFLDKEPE